MPYFLAIVRVESSPEFNYVMTYVLGATWLVLVAYLVLVWRRTKERRRRWRQDLCPECGYDVRMNAEKCPECGTMIRRFARDNSGIVVPDERR